MPDFEILYILETALVLARKHDRPIPAYLITMAMIDAGGLPGGENDNSAD